MAFAEEIKDTVGEAEDIIDGIISFNTLKSEVQDVYEYIDKKLPEGVGGSEDWYVLGLSQSDSYDFSAYRNALEQYLKENEVKGATTRLKFALMLLTVNGDTSYVEKCINDDTIGGQGIMSYVYGLHLINNGYEGKASKDFIIDKLSEFRHEDNGWSVTGEYGDVDVTAMVLQALAPVYKSCINNEADIEDADTLKKLVEEGIEFLSEKQLEDGDFKSFGVRNAESTAQVITALTAFGIDPAQDERFIKNGNSVIDGLKLYLKEDGSFSHKLGEETNPTATVQAFYSMVAYKRMLQGKGSLFEIDALNRKNNVENDIENKNDTAEESPENAYSEPMVEVSDKESQSLPNEGRKKDNGYKSYVIFGIIGIAIIVCAVLAFLKKHYKNYIFVGILALAGILFIIFTDFSGTESYYSEFGAKENIIGTVTMSISCDILIGKSDDEHIPADGCIMKETAFDITDGDSVYDILLEAAKKYGISIEHEGSSDMAYISGINYLYELDYGDLSGWVYKVNGELPSVGCAGYKLKDKDVIEWCYTLDLGNDTMK